MVQIRTAMTELNLLLEEFPDEAHSTTLCTLREQLEKELALTSNRSSNLPPPPHFVSVPRSGDVQTLSLSLNHNNGTDTDVEDPHSAAGPSPSDPRTKLGADTSGPAAYVCPPDAPCRSFRGMLCQKTLYL